MKPSELRTERLLLRPHTPEDVDDVYEICRDEEFSRYLAIWERPYLRGHAEEFCARNSTRDWTTDATWRQQDFEMYVYGLLNLDGTST